MTAHLGTDGSPLVVHVIPSPLGRGAQRARAHPGRPARRTGSGPPPVARPLRRPTRGGARPGPRPSAVAATLPRASNRASPSVFGRRSNAGSGGGGGPWRRPDEVRRAGSHRHRAPVGLLRHRHLRGTADATPRVGMAAHHGPGGSGGGGRRRGARRMHPAFRSGRPSGGRDTERARPVAVPSPFGTGRRGRGGHAHLRGCHDAPEAARSLRRGGGSPAGRGPFVPRHVGRRRTARRAAGRSGGSLRGRAPRFPFGRARTPPPIRRAGVHQPAHRRGHAGRAHRGRTERPPGSVDTGARGGDRARRRPHGGHRRRLGWRRWPRRSASSWTTPSAGPPWARRPAGDANRSSPSTSWPSGGGPPCNRWWALRTEPLAAAGRRWGEGPLPSGARCGPAGAVPTRSGADGGGVRGECTAARGRTAASPFVRG